MAFIVFGVWLLYLIACLCAGSFLVRLLEGSPEPEVGDSPLIRMTTCFLLGQGTLASILVVLGLVGWFAPVAVAGLVAVSILCGARHTWLRVLPMLQQVRSEISALRRDSLLWRLIAGLSVVYVIELGVVSLLPPSGDAVAFYMALPKVVAASHRLVPLKGYYAFSQIGLQGEMHYAAMMSLGSPEATGLLVWSTSLALAIMLLAVGSRIGLRRHGKWIAIVVLLSSLCFTNLVPSGKVDLFGAALGVAAVYWAMRCGSRKSGLALILTALFLGLAIVAKLSYLASLAPAVFLVIGWRYSADRPHGPARNKVQGNSPVSYALTFAFWMTVPILPQLLKNGVLFGEPFAPFITSEAGSWASQTWFAPEITRWIVLSYPLALVYGRYPMQGGNLSPLLLSFAPLVLFLPKPQSIARSSLVQVTAAAISGTFIWILVRPSVLAPRYILSVLVLFIPIVALGAEWVVNVETKPRWLSVGMQACLVAVLLTSFVPFSLGKRAARHVAALLAGQIEECSHAGVSCRASKIINQSAGQGERVYIGTYYRYWLRADLLQCSQGVQEDRALSGSVAPEEAWTYLYRRGFRFLLLNEQDRADLAALFRPANTPKWLTVDTMFVEDDYLAIRLVATDPPYEPQAICAQVDPPAWDVVARGDAVTFPQK